MGRPETHPLWLQRRKAAVPTQHVKGQPLGGGLTGQPGGGGRCRASGQVKLVSSHRQLSCWGWGCIYLQKTKWDVISWQVTVPVPKHQAWHSLNIISLNPHNNSVRKPELRGVMTCPSPQVGRRGAQTQACLSERLALTPFCPYAQMLYESKGKVSRALFA